jgi:hypothetical protein
VDTPIFVSVPLDYYLILVQKNDEIRKTEILKPDKEQSKIKQSSNPFGKQCNELSKHCWFDN